MSVHRRGTERAAAQNLPRRKRPTNRINQSHSFEQPPSRRALTIAALSALLAAPCATACARGDAERPSEDVAPAETCLTYADALRNCYQAIGAPTTGADAVRQAALAPPDPATRRTMNATCAQNLPKLQAGCR